VNHTDGMTVTAILSGLFISVCMRVCARAGNWGCGVFGRDPQWKFLIQWCAATLAGRKLDYYPRDEKSLMGAKDFMHSLKDAGCDTVGGLVQLMCDGRVRRAIGPHMSAFDAIMAALIEQNTPPSPSKSHLTYLPLSNGHQTYRQALTNGLAAPPPPHPGDGGYGMVPSAALPELSAPTAGGHYTNGENPREAVYEGTAAKKERPPMLPPQTNTTASHATEFNHVFEFTFPCTRPKPSVVLLAGSWDGWKFASMRWSAINNRFYRPMHPPPGNYEYKFFVDEEWQCCNDQKMENGPYGPNNVVTIRPDGHAV